MEDRPVVVKIGGSTLGSHDTTLKDLTTLQREGVRLVVVHGGGSIVSHWMERQGTIPRFIRGLRVTDAQSLEVVTAVLTGLVNKQLVASMLGLGAKVMGLSGVDGGLLEAEVANPELGYVGEVRDVNPEVLFGVLAAGYVPMVASVGVHRMDGTPYSGSILNINADTAAGELAYTMEAGRLIFLTDVEGVMDGSGRVIQRLSVRNARLLLSSGVVKGGMIPKLEACLRALGRVAGAEIIDGRVPGALMGCFRGELAGTRITAG